MRAGGCDLHLVGRGVRSHVVGVPRLDCRGGLLQLCRVVLRCDVLMLCAAMIFTSARRSAPRGVGSLQLLILCSFPSRFVWMEEPGTFGSLGTVARALAVRDCALLMMLQRLTSNDCSAGKR